MLNIRVNRIPYTGTLVLPNYTPNMTKVAMS